MFKFNIGNRLSKKSIFAYSIIQRVLIEYVYTSIISPAFSYYGFQNNFDLFRYILSWILYLPIPYFMVSKYTTETLSNQTVIILLNIAYMPSLILYTFHSSTPFIIPLVIYYSILIISTKLIKPMRVSFGNKNEMVNYDLIIEIIAVIIGMAILFIWAYYTHFHLQTSLIDVYGIRLQAREFAMPKTLVYLRSMARSIVPLLAVYSAYKNKWILCVFLVFIQYIQFSIDGAKSAVSVMVLGFLFYFFANRNVSLISYLPKAMSVLATIAIIENKLFHSSFLSFLVFRRVLFTPALINYQYYETAQQYGIDYYRQSLPFLGDSRFPTTIARHIGVHYFDNVNTNSNNGLFADAYINLGVIGCLLMPFAIILILKLIEGSSRELPASIWSICIIQASITFVSCSFFTVLMTHGIILMILLLYTMSPKEEKLLEKGLKMKALPPKWISRPPKATSSL